MSERKATTWITLSDTHIGYQSIEQVNKEFFDEEKGFFAKAREVINEIKEQGIEFSGCAITGDYFESQLSLNSPHSKFAMDLMHAMIHFFIVEHEATLILLRGTRSHDLNQIDIFEPFTVEYEDKFFIVNELATIEINGHDILLIPEEYMKNQEEYYKEVFESNYSFIFGHGYFKKNCFNKNDVERPMPDMPIFDEELFAKIAPITIFGHDHGAPEINDSVWYNGSFSRLQHGQESPKGFLVSYLDLDNDEKSVTLIENELAPSYMSAYLEHIIPKGKTLDYEVALVAIRALKKKVDFLKIKIKSETVLENPTMVELIKNAFSSQYRKGIVIESPVYAIKNGQAVLLENASSIEDEEDNETEEENTSVEDNQYSFLLESSIALEDKISMFINIKHEDSNGADISLEDIQQAISSVK